MLIFTPDYFVARGSSFDADREGEGPSYAILSLPIVVASE
jgi:hypothetical protein